MKSFLRPFAWLAAGIAPVILSTAVIAAEVEPGFKSLFNDKDLTGWAGRPEHWSVEEGAITGRTTKEKPARGNNFLIWRPNGTNGVLDDFELRLSYRIVADNNRNFGDSGIQYRSKELPDFVVSGYQANLMVPTALTGILYEEKGRGIIHQLGQKVLIKTNPDDAKKHKVEVTGSFGKSEEIQTSFKKNDWNDYVISAKGNHLQQFINGKQTADVTDEDEPRAVKSGILAFQIHAGEPMTVQFKNIRLKKLSGDSAKRSDLQQMQGKWVPVEIIANGKTLEAEVLNAIKVTLHENTYKTERPNGVDEGTFKLDESTAPKTMNLTSDSGRDIPAIYEISDDTFKACYAVSNASKPTEFKSVEDSNHILVTYKRKVD